MLNASTIIDAIKQTEERYLGGKVFISDVCKAVGGSSDEVKAWLLALHRLGEVRLSRCDLVSVCPKEKVKASHLPVLVGGIPTADFHFVEVD